MRQFTRIGPGGGGGQIRPSVHPSNPNVLFVVCDMTGWYQTTDSGKSWRQINLNGVVRACAFDELNPNCIYAGNSGLYRSMDLGKTWRLIFPDPAKVIREVEAYDHASHRYESTDNWPGGTILGIAVDPESSNHVHLAIYCDRRLLLYSSSDACRSFRKIAEVVPGNPENSMGDSHAVKAFFVDSSSPANKRILYLVVPSGLYGITVESGQTTHTPPPEDAGLILQADWGMNGRTKKPVFYITTPTRRGSGGLYRTTSNGTLKWRLVNTNMLHDLHPASIDSPPQFGAIAVAKGNPATAFVECSDHREKSDKEAVWGYPFGVFKTTDGGRTWKWVFRSAWNERALNNVRDGWLTRWLAPGRDGGAIHIAVAPSNPNVVWRVTAMCSSRSLDGGITWKSTYNNWLPDGSVTTNGMDVTTCYGVHFDPHVEDRMFISYTDIGLWRSDNRGKSWWQSKGGIPNSWTNTCYWMVFDPAVQDRMWSVWSSCHDLPRPKMFASGWGNRTGGVAFSGDGGKNWHPWTNGMPDNSVPTHIILDSRSPAGSRTLYVAVFNRGIYRSDNDGRDWRLMNKGINPSNLFAWRLAQAPNGNLFVCIARGGKEDGNEVDGALYSSTDHGETWHEIPLPPGVNAPNDLAVDPRNSRNLYLACWPRTVRGEPVSGGIWQSRDAGRHWTCILDQRLHCYAITVDPSNTDRLYCCGFNSSIFRSDDQGRNWRRLGGYNFKMGHRVTVDPRHSDRIFVTTFGGSVFRGPSGGTGQAFEDIHKYVNEGAGPAEGTRR